VTATRAEVNLGRLDREALLSRIEDFHGHLGPYVIFGFRAGQLALRVLEAKGFFDLEADVHCGDRPPVSCFADGVQLGSGCTTGKGNLKVTGGPPDRPPSPSSVAPPAPPVPLTVLVRPDVAARAGRWLDELGDRESAMRILELPDEELFEVRRGS